MPERQQGILEKTEISMKNLPSQPETGRGCPSLTLCGDEPNALLGGFFPFFSFCEWTHCLAQSLAGDELDESKNSQLSTLREDFVRRPLEREPLLESDGQMSSMRTSESLERREETHACGRVATLPVSVLRLSIFGKVKAFRPLFPSFSSWN